MRILLTEDDRMIGAAIHQALRDAAYTPDWVRNGADAVEAVEAEEYELILLDLGLPAMGGLDILAHLRGKKLATPIIIITARDGVDDRIAGLDLGADDYLVKPFDVAELLARIRAVLRRRGHDVVSALSNGVISLDQSTFEATSSDAVCRLTNREFALMRALLQHPGSVLSRQDLERQIYGWNEEVESNAVEFLIRSVRKKLGQTAIRNIRGLGWAVERGA